MALNLAAAPPRHSTRDGVDFCHVMFQKFEMPPSESVVGTEFLKPHSSSTETLSMLRSTSLALRARIIDAPLSTSSNPSFAAFHSSSVVAATLKGRGRALSLSKGRRTPKGLSRTQYSNYPSLLISFDIVL